jgi:filamentous hemagglutinin family protein
LISTESATFTGPSNVQNILARVTSGSPSSIDGKVSSQIQGANLFFLNPAGVIFGPHAQLDVSGSVAISTANYVKMVGGGRFNANLGGSDTFTSAPVSAFGFLNSTPAGVSILGSNTFDANDLVIVPGPGVTVSVGKSLSIVAGDIAMNGAYVTGAGSGVNLVSVRSAGEVLLDATNVGSVIDVRQFKTMGEVSLTNFALIKTSGPGGGPVSIDCGKLVMTSGAIQAFTLGSEPGRGVSLIARDSIDITDGAEILTGNASSGKAGDILVETGAMTIDGSDAPVSLFFGTPITQPTGIDASSGFGAFGASGAAGDITVRVSGRLALIGGGHISTGTASSAKGGHILVEAGSIRIDGEGLPAPTGIDAGSNIPEFGGSGDAGDVNVKVTGALTIRAGGTISTNTNTSGKGGNVLVEAGSVRINGDGLMDITGIEATAGFGGGDAGNVTVEVSGPLAIRAGGEISTSSFISGNGGNVLVQADSLTIRDASISALVFGGTGNGGNIDVKVLGLVYLLDSTISATSGSTGGNITIDPQFIVLDNSPISASATLQGGAIVLDSNYFFGSNSPVTATGGITNGTVTITAPSLDLGAELITLPNSLLSAENQLCETCIEVLQGDFSSFISVGRGGTEPEPDELQDEF